VVIHGSIRVGEYAPTFLTSAARAPTVIATATMMEKQKLSQRLMPISSLRRWTVWYRNLMDPPVFDRYSRIASALQPGAMPCTAANSLEA
jgi:hypothetical protein